MGIAPLPYMLMIAKLYRVINSPEDITPFKGDLDKISEGQG